MLQDILGAADPGTVQLTDIDSNAVDRRSCRASVGSKNEQAKLETFSSLT